MVVGGNKRRKLITKKCISDISYSKYVDKILWCVFYSDNFYFLEINTLPGMTETSLFPMAAKRHGFSFEDIINNIIKLSLQK